MTAGVRDKPASGSGYIYEFYEGKNYNKKGKT